MLVAVFHIFEAPGASPEMGWGQERGIGHDLELAPDAASLRIRAGIQGQRSELK